MTIVTSTIPATITMMITILMIMAIIIITDSPLATVASMTETKLVNNNSNGLNNYTRFGNNINN